MKLYENPEVVNELKRILKKDYPYLEYSDRMSKKMSEDLKSVINDQLYVSVRPNMMDVPRARSVIEDVCEKLSQVTGIPFSISHVQPVGRFYKGDDQRVPPQKLEVQWYSFCLKKRHI